MSGLLDLCDQSVGIAGDRLGAAQSGWSSPVPSPPTYVASSPAALSCRFVSRNHRVTLHGCCFFLEEDRDARPGPTIRTPSAAATSWSSGRCGASSSVARSAATRSLTLAASTARAALATASRVPIETRRTRQGEISDVRKV